MCDHLIVWPYGLNNSDYRPAIKDLYGIDLCLHPELKDRFESCKDGSAD